MKGRKRMGWIVGLLWLAVMAVCWFAIPGWREMPGGFWLLIGAVTPGVVAVARDAMELFKDDRPAQQNIEGVNIGGDAAAARDFIAHDQINVYIQSHPEVSAADLEQQLQAYLGWVCEKFGDIVLRGVEKQNSQLICLPLDAIYVPLQAEYDLPADETPQGEPPAGEDAAQGKPVGRPETRTEQVLLSELLSLDARLMITGGPGCGKSTVLQHIAWALAESLTGRQPTLAEQKLGLKGELPLPIYVPLSLFGVYLRDLPKTANGQQKSLATYIANYLLERSAGLSFDPGFLAHLIQMQRPVLLLLDGLDEVPDADLRIQVSGRIDDLVSGRENLRVIVTSRTSAYYGRAMLRRRFQQVRVQPLDAEQIEQLVRQAYAAIHSNSPSRAKTRADELLAGIARLEANRRALLGEDAEPLVTTPLMVRMFLIVHMVEGRQLPEQRADLYQKVVDALLRPDYNLDDRAASEIEHRIGGSLAINREMLQYLAFHLHSRGDQQGREIEEAALREILNGEETFAPFVQDLIEQSSERGTLLEERGGSYRFIHLSFQEFLAARYLAQTYKASDAADFLLRQHLLLDSWWREPVLLLVGYLDVTAPLEARKLLLRLVDDAALQQTDDLRTAAAELAASAYLECQQQAADLQERLKPHLQRAFSPENQAPARLRAAAGDALARLGDPRFDPARFFLPAPDAAWPEEDLWGFLHIPAGPFRMGSRRDDPQAYPDEYDQHDVTLPDYYLARYPVTAAQFRASVPEGRPDWNGPDNHPVVSVSWHDAQSYCGWLTDRLRAAGAGQLAAGGLSAAQSQFWGRLVQAQWRVLLPSEAEWEKAARGPGQPLVYPWGNEFDADCANVGQTGPGGTSAVGCFASGRSPYNALDMAGNVWEWTRSGVAGYPYDAADGRENPPAGDGDRRVLRGGSFNGNPGYSRCACRNRYLPSGWDYNCGFRVVIVSPIHLGALSL